MVRHHSQKINRYVVLAYAEMTTVRNRQMELSVSMQATMDVSLT